MTTPSVTVAMSDLNSELGFTSTATVQINHPGIRAMASNFTQGSQIDFLSLRSKSFPYVMIILNAKINFLRSFNNGKNWELCSPAPPLSFIYGCTSPFNYWASDSSLNIWNSTDGKTWVQKATAVGELLNYVNGYLVAVSGATIKYSTDGITWTTRSTIKTSLGNNVLHIKCIDCVTLGGVQYWVAGGLGNDASGEMLWFYQGSGAPTGTFTPTASQPGGEVWSLTAAFGNVVFASSVGWIYWYDSALAWHSYNLANAYDKMSFVSLANGRLYATTAGNSSSFVHKYTTDLVTFTDAGLPTNMGFIQVKYKNSTYVASCLGNGYNGSWPAAAYSTNGTSWTNSAESFDYSYLTDPYSSLLI